MTLRTRWSHEGANWQLKFLLRRGCTAPSKMRSWTDKHRKWVMQLKFDQRALEETLTDYAAEADHQCERVARLERAIDEAVDKVPRRCARSSTRCSRCVAYRS